MRKTLTEKRFFEWYEDDRSVTLRNNSGSYGGGSEVLIVEILYKLSAAPIIKACVFKAVQKGNG